MIIAFFLKSKSPSPAPCKSVLFVNMSYIINRNRGVVNALSPLRLLKMLYLPLGF